MKDGFGSGWMDYALRMDYVVWLPRERRGGAQPCQLHVLCLRGSGFGCRGLRREGNRERGEVGFDGVRLYPDSLAVPELLL